MILLVLPNWNDLHFETKSCSFNFYLHWSDTAIIFVLKCWVFFKSLYFWHKSKYLIAHLGWIVNATPQKNSLFGYLPSSISSQGKYYFNFSSSQTRWIIFLSANSFQPFLITSCCFTFSLSRYFLLSCIISYRKLSLQYFFSGSQTLSIK